MERLAVVSLTTLLLIPAVSHAAVTFTSGSQAPYVSSIAVKHGSEFVSASKMTNGNVTVVVSIESNGKSYTIDDPLNSDSYTFTENGSYTFLFHDQDGATGSSTITVDTIDKIAPEITIGAFSTTATAEDVLVSATVNEGTLNADTHTFTDNGSFDFVAVDEAGNVATSTVTISHIDRTPPVIERVGDRVVQLRVGTPYDDPGATATDAYDGVVSVVRTGSVNVDAAGSYTLTYTATDTAGNTATVERVVEMTRGSSGGGGGSRVSSTTTTEETVGRVLGAATYNFVSDLSMGSTGEEVHALQEALASRGLFGEAPTGYFGAKTQAALKAFQASHGIPQTGVLGPRTRAALMATSTAPPSVAAQIAQLQALLAVLQQRLAALTTGV